MGWILRVIDHFSSAHFLKNYQGACERLHGHNWKVEIEVKGDKLDDSGILMDFKILKSILKEVLSVLDHRLINEVYPFTEINPSSENIAKFIFDEVKRRLPSHVKMHSVCVWESDTSCAVYIEN